MDKKQRLKSVKKILKKAKDLKLNLDKITEGKSVETLAHSNKTIENLKKRFKRQKEQPILKAEVEKINKRIQERKEQREEKKRIKKEKDLRRNLITDESKSVVKWKMEMDYNQPKSFFKKETEKVANEFLYKYFKQISFDYDAQVKIDRLAKRFGARLDLIYDFIKYVEDQSYKYELEGVVFERDFIKENLPEDFRQELYKRLDEFERIVNKEFNL